MDLLGSYGFDFGLNLGANSKGFYVSYPEPPKGGLDLPTGNLQVASPRSSLCLQETDQMTPSRQAEVEVM